jgi:large repetitive protein
MKTMLRDINALVFALANLVGMPAAASPVIGAEIPITQPVTGPAFNQQQEPAIAYGGGNFMAVWSDQRTGVPQIFGARFQSNGTLLDPAGIQLTSAAVGASYPALSFNGTNFLLVYVQAGSATTYDQVVVERISPSGAVLDTTPIPLISETSAQRAPAVASDGTQWLAAWQSSATEAARVSASGQLLDPTGIPVTGIPLSFGYPVKVGFNGTDFVVAQQQYVARISTAGVDLDATPLTSSGFTDDIGCASGTCVIVWGNGGGVWGVRFASNGTFLDASPVQLGTTAVSNTDASASIVAANGGFTVAYNESSTLVTGMAVRAVRISSSLATIGSSFDVFTTPDMVSPQAIASDGTTSFVVWPAFVEFMEDRGQILGARLAATGGPLDANPLLVSVGAATQQAPAVAFDGTNALVVWQERRWNTQEDIYAARVAASGTVLDPAGIPVATTTDIEREPAVAFDGSHYLVAWSTYSNGLWAQQLSTAGVLLGTAIQLGDAAIASKDYPAAAFDGTNVQVAWQFGNNEIDLKRVSTAGVAVDANPIPVATSSSYIGLPSNACDGTNCLVVWEDDQTNAGAVYGMRVSKGGTLVDATPIAITPSSGYLGVTPKVTFDGTNYLVVWSDSSVSAARVSPAGVVLDNPAVSLANGGGAAVSWEGTEYFVAWGEYASSTSANTYGDWLSTSASPLDAAPTQITTNNSINQGLAAVSIGPGVSLLSYSVYDNSSQFNAWRVRARIIERGANCVFDSDCTIGFCDNGTCVTCPSTPCNPGFVCTSLGTCVAPDAGSPGTDAGLVADAGPLPDSGSAADAGIPADSGSMPDSGSVQPDSGSVPTDSGSALPDASSRLPDAGPAASADAGASTSNPGCGCGHTEDAVSWVYLIALAGLAIGRARKRA